MLSLRMKLRLSPKTREAFLSCNSELGDALAPSGTDGSGARYEKYSLDSKIRSLIRPTLISVRTW